ncbi:hypothetical protein MMC28_011015 [Mycoblastus sanguinarius]|nr:hypothetical protein [Mycoblastus sanguinarius]
MRNFYVAASDQTDLMPNVQLPYEQSYGTCSVQLLLATEFVNVPHDHSAWINLIGPARNILRECVISHTYGGIVVENGENQAIEIVVYAMQSIYAKNRIIKYSPDPLAKSIAVQELLDLLRLTPGISDAQIQAEIAMLDIGTANTTSPSLQSSAAGSVATA